MLLLSFKLSKGIETYGDENNVDSGRSSGSSLETHRGTCVNKYALRRRSQTSSAVDGRPYTQEYIGLFRYGFFRRKTAVYSWKIRCGIS